ncbi:MAG: PaaI family thioesterase [Hyphomonadaceae bacterium]|nr:PaaI family thioesterase [Hyphomonadaceae bacterium]
MTQVRVEGGEFAGWSYWEDEPYEAETVGPFFFRLEGETPVAAFRAERRHMNGAGVVHGGCLLSFADFSLFAIANHAMDGGYGLTVALTSEFLSGPKEGALVEARGEVLRAGGSLIFVRGIVTGDGVPCLNFSGTIKRLRNKS